MYRVLCSVPPLTSPKGGVEFINFQFGPFGFDPGFEQQLPQVIGRQNDWKILNCRPGSRLQAGEVLVVPINRQLGFAEDGSLAVSDEPWPGPYQPSIETVLDLVSRQFGPACGAIIFSGMGEDGVAACGRLRQQGSEVWTQDTVSLRSFTTS